MHVRLKHLLVISSTLLILQPATAQPVSTSTSLTLEQGLSCLDWANKEQSFSNQLAFGARGNASAYGMAKLQKQFQQQYREQKSKVLQESDEDFCEDCPEAVVYLPKSKTNPIQRIETLMQVSVAAANTSIYRNDQMLATKQRLEDGLNIKFKHYSGQDFETFKQQQDKAIEQDPENRRQVQQIFQRYPHLNIFNGEVFRKGKTYIPQQIYVYSQPYKRDAYDTNGMIAFISLYDNPVDPSQHILQCGFTDNVF